MACVNLLLRVAAKFSYLAPTFLGIVTFSLVLNIHTERDFVFAHADHSLSVQMALYSLFVITLVTSIVCRQGR